MVLTLTLGALVLVVLVKITMGPARWHRVVVEDLRPGSWPPSPRGEALVVVRDVAALVVLTIVLVPALLDWVAGWRTDERLYDATLAAEEILPAADVEPDRLEALLEALTGEEVSVEDSPIENSEDDLYEVRWAPDDESVVVEPEDLPEPAACVEVDGDGDDAVATATEGSCDQRDG